MEQNLTFHCAGTNYHVLYINKENIVNVELCNISFGLRVVYEDTRFFMLEIIHISNIIVYV